MIAPAIQELNTKTLVGIHLEMSLANNRTAELWKAFVPRLNEINNRKDSDRISMQVYPQGYFASFHPATPFTKWAAVEVYGEGRIPEGMETFTLPAGLYAAFHYKGSSSDTRIFSYIFQVWLPASGYQLDDRPHFEVLGEKYRNNDPDSEEEIWIPIKAASSE